MIIIICVVEYYFLGPETLLQCPLRRPTCGQVGDCATSEEEGSGRVKVASDLSLKNACVTAPVRMAWFPCKIYFKGISYFTVLS